MSAGQVIENLAQVGLEAEIIHENPSLGKYYMMSQLVGVFIVLIILIVFTIMIAKMPKQQLNTIQTSKSSIVSTHI